MCKLLINTVLVQIAMMLLREAIIHKTDKIITQIALLFFKRDSPVNKDLKGIEEGIIKVEFR